MPMHSFYIILPYLEHYSEKALYTCFWEIKYTLEAQDFIAECMLLLLKVDYAYESPKDFVKNADYTSVDLKLGWDSAFLNAPK